VSAKRPTVGVVSTHGEDRCANYLRALEQHGGVSLILKPGTAPELDLVHALLLTGGGDLAEAHYTHPPDAEERATLGKIEPERDEFEFRLLAWAAEREIPVLGICRGMQTMGAFAGGRLIPDLPIWRSRTRGVPTVPHRGNGGDATHEIEVTPDSRLARAFGKEGRALVNSSHHQALLAPPTGWRIGATSADGILEAIEAPRRAFWLGVQFHPERMACNPAAAAAIFTAFLHAARQT